MLASYGCVGSLPMARRVTPHRERFNGSSRKIHASGGPPGASGEPSGRAAGDGCPPGPPFGRGWDEEWMRGGGLRRLAQRSAGGTSVARGPPSSHSGCTSLRRPVEGGGRVAGADLPIVRGPGSVIEDRSPKRLAAREDRSPKRYTAVEG